MLKLTLYPQAQWLILTHEVVRDLATRSEQPRASSLGSFSSIGLWRHEFVEIAFVEKDVILFTYLLSRIKIYMQSGF